MSKLTEWATLGTALGSGLIAGVFFTFSAFVMPALHRLPAARGIAAMQSINKLAVTPPLMIVLFATALVAVVLGIGAVRSWGQPASPWVVAGAALYVVGVIIVTAAGNVPLNNALATVHQEGTGAAAHWSGFYGHWLIWNHVRCAAALGAAGLLTVGFRLR
jgi:uncharacterized membrane protein